MTISYTRESIKKEALKYNRITHFKKYSNEHYNFALKKGILKEMCSHMSSKKIYPDGYYNNINNLIKIAKKYNSRWDFQQNDRGAYLYSRRNGILEEVCSHMKDQKINWESLSLKDKKTKIKEIANKYVTKNEFKKNDQYVVKLAKSISESFYQSICSHMIKPPPSNQKRSEKDIVREIKRLRGIQYKEFRMNHKPLYDAFIRLKNKNPILAKKLMKNFSGTIKTQKNEVRTVYWTKERVHQEALLYNRRVDFKNGNKTAYNAAFKFKIIDHVCSHMISNKESLRIANERKNKKKEIGSKIKFQEILEYSKGKIFSMEQFLREGKREYYNFLKSKLGRKIYSKKFLKLIKNNKKEYSKSLSQFTKDLEKEEFQKYFPEIWNEASFIGVISSLKFKKKVVKKKPIKKKVVKKKRKIVKKKWTQKMILEAALETKTTANFNKKYSGAYTALLRNYDQNSSFVKKVKGIFESSKRKSLEKRKYEKTKRCIIEAKKYLTRKEFFINEPSLCNFAFDNNIKEAKEHFEKIARSSHGEFFCKQILTELLNEKFIKTKKILDSGYELDGYSKKLNLAFEYNGKQHYQRIKYFHKTNKDFENQKKRDREKEKECKKKGILLIVVPYTVKFNNLESYIKNKLDKLGIKYKNKKVKLKLSKGTLSVKWNQKTIKAEAKTYKRRIDFRDGNKTAYNAALKLGILEEVCSHMMTNEEVLIEAGKKRRKWTEEKLKQLAKKCKSKTIMIKEYKSAYNAALNIGIIKELFPEVS